MVEDNSGAPVEGEVSAETRRDSLAGMMESQAANKDFEGEEVEAPGDEGVVAFVAAAEFANYKVLVKEGNIIENRNNALQPGMRSREGFIKARFVNGVLATDDPDIIAWCDAHPKICRRATDALTKGWVSMKEMTVKRANRERLQDPSDMDADGTFPPGAVMNDRLREQAASPDSVGGKLVESAERTKQSLEQNK